MASRMIHFVIAQNILKYIDLNDGARFIIGAIAPDACSHNDGSYDECHFTGRSLDGKYKGVNWNLFELKYGSELMSDSLYLGYFCHLIEDAVCLHDMADKYVRKYSSDIRSEYYSMGYRDYARLNKLLLLEYKLVTPEFTSLTIPVDEIQDKYIKNHFDGFINDFAIDIDCCKEDLELYHWELIEEYIGKCTELCVNEIEAMRKQGRRMNPEEYYVTVD